MVVLNDAELSQALADLYRGWFYSIWTAYWVTRFLLNCQLDGLNIAELSQVLAELYGEWFYSIYVNCLLGDYILTELSTGWLKYCRTFTGTSWIVYRVILLYVNCLLDD